MPLPLPQPPAHITANNALVRVVRMRQLGQKGRVASAAWPFLFSPATRQTPPKFPAVKSSIVFAIVVGFCCGPRLNAQDEKSINDLRNALVALSPETVDPNEAAVLSETAHRSSRQCAREYGVSGDPAIHNYLIHIGVKKRG